MANEIQFPGVTGKTAYAYVQNSIGQYANAGVFEAYNAAHWTNYAITMTEQGVSGDYLGTFPIVAQGRYNIVVRYQQGGSPAVFDPSVGMEDGFQWSGTVAAIMASPTNITAGTITNLTNLPSIPANWLTSTGIASSAFTSSKFAAGFIVNGSFGAGAISAGVIGANAITGTVLATGCITSTQIADGAIDTATFAAGTTIPRCTLTDTLTTYTGNIVQSGDSYIRLGAPVGASISADIAAKPTAVQNATTWGSSIVGNSRTRDQYLMGLTNKATTSVDGLTVTLYSYDDSTILQTIPTTRLATTVGGIKNLTPA